MRHVFAALPISAGTISVGKATPSGILVSSSCRTLALTAGSIGAFSAAIALAAIAMTAKQDL